MTRFRHITVRTASLLGLASLFGVLGSSPATAQTPEPEKISDFRAEQITKLQSQISIQEYEHKDCPPNEDPRLTNFCMVPTAGGNPDTALRGEGAFMASIGPPAVFFEPGVGDLTEDNWKERHYCGGTLIAQGWVLTAAHCVSTEKVEAGFRVRLGMSNLELPEGKHFTIDRVVCFKKSYCSESRPNVLYRHDIALLHFTADPADFAPALDPQYFRERGVDTAALSADGRAVTTWSQDGTKRRWDVINGAELSREAVPVAEYNDRYPATGKTPGFPQGNINLINDTKLVSALGDRTLSWEHQSGSVPGSRLTNLHFEDLSSPASDSRRTIQLPGIQSIRFAEDNAYLVGFKTDLSGIAEVAAVEPDGSRIRWTRDFEFKASEPIDGLFFPDAYFVEPSVLNLTDKTALIGVDDAADLLSAETGELLARFQHPRDVAWNGRSAAETDIGTRNLVTAGKVVADGRQLLTVTQRYSASDIWLWDVASGELIQRFAQEDPLISEYALDARLIAGGTRLLSWSQYGTLHLWDVATGNSLAMMEQRLPVKDVTLAQQDRIAAVRDDAGLTIWDLAAGKQLGRMDHLNWVYGAAMSPDGTMAISWSEDATARIWSTQDGAEMQRIYHNGGINGARFTDDGKRILSWSEDGTARITNVPSGTVDMIFDVARNPAGSPLTPPIAQQPERKTEVAYLPIAGSSYELEEYDQVAVYGWGKTRDEDGWQPYASLMRIQLGVLDNNDCSEMEGMESSRRYPRVNPDIFCGQSDRQKTCKGDSGGPVMLGGIVVGIVNWGKTTCAGTGETGVYARVANYADWIAKQIGDDAGLTVLDAPLPYDSEASD